MNKELNQLLLSLRLGDGSYPCSSEKLGTYKLYTSSIKEDYIKYKRSILTKNGIYTRDVNAKSGYGSDKKIFAFSTNIEKCISEVAVMDKIDVINSLDMNGLILYYLDDGSLHKSKRTIHLYCSSFSDEEVECLVNKVHELLKEKIPKRYNDIKRDGRVFPYLYLPVDTAKVLSEYTREFLLNNKIDSLLYKTIPPSQTIERIAK